MAKLCGQDVSTDEDKRIEAEVDAVLAQFGGDVHAAIMALLQEFAVLVHAASALEVGIFDGAAAADADSGEPEDPDPHNEPRGVARRRLQ
ncbi:MAG: hypothetical protein J0H01_21935 [Rhizobiales bacterium]|nr:hypothetical protein [Hyphomicrobiales bacterium]